MKIEYKNKEKHNTYISKLNCGDVFKFVDEDDVYMKIHLEGNSEGIDGTLFNVVQLINGSVYTVADTEVEQLEANLLILVTK